MLSESLPQLAVIDDDDILRGALVYYLEDCGYPVWWAESAEAFYKALHQREADIVLVDLTLPGEDGLSVINHLRKTSDRGLIAVTGRGERDDRVIGLQQGADHYLVKPVDFGELEAAISALWRRMCMDRPRQSPAEPWRIDSAQRRLYGPRGRYLPLSDQEYKLLCLLLEQADQVISKDRLHQVVFPKGIPLEPHRIEVILSRIRAKARQAGMELPLRAVFGKGLVFIQGRSP